MDAKPISHWNTGGRYRDVLGRLPHLGVVITALLLPTLLSGCLYKTLKAYKGGPKFSPIREVPADAALIYVYRHVEFGWYDDEPVTVNCLPTMLSGGAYQVFYAPAPMQVLMTSDADSVSIDVLPGETHYVEWVQGSIMGWGRMVARSQEEGKERIRSTRLQQSTQGIRVLGADGEKLYLTDRVVDLESPDLTDVFAFKKGTSREDVLAVLGTHARYQRSAGVSGTERAVWPVRSGNCEPATLSLSFEDDKLVRWTVR